MRAYRRRVLLQVCSLLLLTVALISSGSAHAQVPVVFRVSEGVRPDSLVSLYGEFLTDTTTVRFLKADGTVAAETTAVQTDRGGRFCRVVFPEIAPGTYRLAVKNGAGWSPQALHVNRAEPRWASDDCAYPGMRLKIIGRNLDGREYNGALETQIRLIPVKEDNAVTVTPDDVNPYCVDFTVPTETRAGEYVVEITTGSAEFGQNWVRLDNHSEFPEQVRDTVIRIASAPTNPLARALEVGWANEFSWDRRVDAKKDFQARGDGTADDTDAIQKALDHVGQGGGGVVVLPAGTYRISRLAMPSRCVLLGDGPEKTTVLITNATEEGAVVTNGNTHGLAAMTFCYEPSVPAKTQGKVLAGTAQHLFIHDVTFDLLRTPDVSAQQFPYYFTGDGPMLVARCRFHLSSRNQWDHVVRNRVTFRDNVIDMHDGLGFCMSSEKLLLLRNDLTFHPAPFAGQMNGFFLNEGWVGWNIYNAYIADNNAHDLRGPGDCQPYAADSAWSCFAGTVTRATADEVDVRVDIDADSKRLDTHEMELLVVQGRGLGQLRRLVQLRKVGDSPTVVRCRVAPAWDVPPDTSSVISAGSWHVNNVFYGNRAEGSKSPYNMYYGGCYDCVDAEAVSENTEGWNNWGRIGEMPDGKAWHCPVYFNQLKRSTFTGKAPQYDTMGITLRVENETKNYRGIGDYGTEVRDNTIDRAACSNSKQRLTGNAAIATFNQSWMKMSSETPLIFATLCEGNRIRHSTTGFDLDGSFGFAIRGTILEGCPNLVNDRGHDTALLPGDPGPFTPKALRQGGAVR